MIGLKVGFTGGGARLAKSGALALALLVALGGVSHAGEPREARRACISSVFKLCPVAALAGDHAGAKACLLRNLEKATPQCQVAVRAVLATDAASRSPG
jgi:hypothetical protein